MQQCYHPSVAREFAAQCLFQRILFGALLMSTQRAYWLVGMLTLFAFGVMPQITVT